MSTWPRLSPKDIRRLLADLVALEVSEDLGADALSGFARSDCCAAAGRSVDSLSEITQVYEAGVKAFQRKQETKIDK